MTTFQNFTIVIEADDPAGWHAFVPELPGCHSFGDTPTEAKESLTEAIYAYLLEQKSQNREVKTQNRFVDHISMAIPA
jgi:predicted RNase H-like HicB family nuclease